ncbi:MAG: hypothetical protein NXY57DRAFT_961791 [Lentinula lateritia]|uniref:Uncharacterized protein n=1 Tax=Lentinula lateritia TaxID=40482 RepID=A0ABQ8V6V3_9AGAR|nr:hypothetical protein EV359DRAFT_85913 [Lentinula novae-zelandiae]KAJ3931411.1 MAG: hypothetical protein NXY57DRAFT_961791 [Lentinula lateritia]KAJ4476294.1 hypothetical protein C8R41DRAFT_923422 [Lentinula lateritia]
MNIHPYVIAAATVARVVVGTEFMVPSLFLGLLRLFGFAMSGPVAGSRHSSE